MEMTGTAIRATGSTSHHRVAGGRPVRPHFFGSILMSSVCFLMACLLASAPCSGSDVAAGETINKEQQMDEKDVGSAASDRPYDENEVRKILAARAPVSGSVQVINGRPVLVASDGARSVVTYKHLLDNPSHTVFAQAGIHFQFALARDEERGSGYDFSYLEHAILKCLWEDPQAYVIVEMCFDPTREWAQSHLDSVWTADDGKPYVIQLSSWWAGPYRKGSDLRQGEILQGSFGAPDYLEWGANKARALGDFLRTHDVGKVVVGFCFWGGNDGEFWPVIWYHFATPTLKDWQLDHSKGSTQGFRQWLREVYHDSVPALREAWDDPSVTFENAELCSEADRVSDQPFFRGKGKAQHVVDSQRWGSVSRNLMLQHWSRAFKTAIGKPAFAMTWSSDALYGLNLGHYAISDLLEGPNRLETTSSTSAYGETREAGGIGRTFLCWGAYRLRGALAVRELDNRPRPAKDFRAQIIRDIGAVAAEDMGVWFYEMGDWYRPRPELWPTLAEANRILEWARREDVPHRPAEMAVFVDEEAGHRAAKNHQEILSAHTMGQQDALNTSGVPYDVYYLDDIRNSETPDYKVYLFLSAFTLNRAQVDAIRCRCAQGGKMLVFLGPVGIGSADYDNPHDLVRELANIPGATVMLLQLHDEAGGLTADFIQGVAKMAGIRTMGTAGQVTHIGNGVAVVHRIQSGPATVVFGSPVDLIDPKDGTTILANAVTEWQPQCELKDTAVVFYRPAAGGVSESPAGASIGVGECPVSLVYDGANVWVANWASGSISKVRASDSVVLETVALGGSGTRALAYDGASIWVANELQGRLAKVHVSDGTILAVYDTPSPVALAFDGTGVWVANNDRNTVTKLRAADGVLLGTFPVGDGPEGLAFDGSAIWVANAYDGTVTKLRASDGDQIGVYPAGPRPSAVVCGGPSIWVANPYGSSVVRLSASDGSMQGTVKVEGEQQPRGLLFDGTSIWLTTFWGGALMKMDPSTGAVEETHSMGGGPYALVSDGTSIWVAKSVANAVTKVPVTPSAPR